MRKNGLQIFLRACLIAGIALLIICELWVHHQVPYMMDDLWYSTNLATGEKLHGFQDIVESQIWHFFHWGGRCMTHGVLQMVLMCPEWIADLMNVGMAIFLAIIICRISHQKGTIWFLMAFSMLVSLNANWKMSMFWQSGTVNYVYSSVWIFLFIRIYLRQMEEPEAKPIPFICIWILPLGLFAGWSNENMGPVCFLLTIITMVYVKRKGGGKGVSVDGRRNADLLNREHFHDFGAGQLYQSREYFGIRVFPNSL